MSGNEGPTPPPEQRPDGPSEPVPPAPTPPPYPGWSTQQPPDQGWQQPGGPSAWDAPGQSPGSPASTGPAGPGAGPGAQVNGWQNTPEWTWRQPDVKPGVIPLRPLGVGEILDGAVTTIRRNPAAMLGLSAVVAVVSQVLVLGASWLFLSDIATADQLSSAATPDELLDAVSSSVAPFLVSAFVTWVGTVFVTGVLTVVVGRAVLGENLTAGQAWNAAKGRLLRLLGLTFVYTVIWLGALIVIFVASALAGLLGSDVVVPLMVIGAVAAIPVGVWLYVRYALAGPSLMLETTDTGNGGARPLGITGAFRRSAQLVRGSWWRVFGILVLVNVIVWIITQVVAVPFNIPTLVGGGLNDNTSFGALAISSLGGIVAGTITAPFSAAATALLYIDRRIRREGLDLELARAAGVDHPGRQDRPDGSLPGNP